MMNDDSENGYALQTTREALQITTLSYYVSRILNVGIPRTPCELDLRFLTKSTQKN